jgi:very-short-patch-repair endonuclease
MIDDNQRPANTSPELWAKLKPLAREMRHVTTHAEERLWQRLRNRRVQDAKFRRQHAIDRFIVDFYCADVRLIIEVDGVLHQYTPDEDALRQEFLESIGLIVVRFTNDEVLNSLNTVVERIGEILVERMKSCR